MIRIISGFAVVAALSLGLPAWSQAPQLEKMDAVQRALPDGPVALVDGSPITKDDFLFLYTSQLARMHLASGGKGLPEDVRVKAGIGTLAELVQREILSQYGDRHQIKVSQSEVNKAYQEQLELLIREFTIDGKVPNESEILARSGQSREDAIEDMHQSLLVEKASRKLAEEKGLQITDAEAREFYDKNKDRFQRPGMIHLHQIFARAAGEEKAADDSWAQAEEAIKKAQGRLQVGETFAGIAKSMSDGRDAQNGGDMGMRPVQAIPPIYVEKSQSLEVGETSAPFKSDQGWHIIRLEAREGAENVSFEEARDWIKERLMEVKVAAAVEEYCEPILEDPDRVEIFLKLRVPESTRAANS